jgi:hypothetical protein
MSYQPATMARRDQPHLIEHQVSVERSMGRGRMPRTLAGLLHWFVIRLREETPDKLHRSELWRDQVSAGERDVGLQPVGGSHLGSLAYSGAFRALLEGSPSQTDADGYYVFPVRSALSRIHRRRPLMARFLFAIGMAEGDWQSVAAAMGYPDEMVEVYAEASLRSLWEQTYDRSTKGMA